MGAFIEAARSLLTGTTFDPHNAVPDLYSDIAVRSAQLDYDQGKFSGFRVDLGIASQVGGNLMPRYKYVRLMRLTRIAPIEIQRAAEGQALVDLHRDLIMGLLEQFIHPVTLVANDPMSLGLLFCAGVQAEGPTPEAAKAAAIAAGQKLQMYYTGVYRQCTLRDLTPDEAHWLHVRLQSWQSLAVFRGLPQPRREASMGLVTPLAGVTMESTVEQQIEQFCRAMANEQFIFSILASPLSEVAIGDLLKGVSLHLEKVRSDVQVQESHTAGVSLPFLFAGNAGGSQSLSHGLSAGQGHTQSFSEGRSAGETVGQSMTQSHGVSESVSHSVGQSSSLGTGFTQGHGASLSHSYGSSLSASHGNTIGQGSSASASHGVSQSRGEQTSQGITRSSGSSVGRSQGMSTSHGVGTSTSNSGSISRGTSQSSGTSVGQNSSLGSSYGNSQGTGSSAAENVKGGFAPIGVGGSGGFTHTNSVSGSVSSGGSSSIGSSTGASSSAGSSFGATSGSSVGSSQSFGQSTSMGSSQSLSQSVANSASLSNSASIGSSASLGLGRSVSSGESIGTSQGVTSGVGAGQSGSVGLSNSASQGVSSGMGTSSGVSQSLAQGVSSSQSQGVSASSGVASSQTLGQSSGDGLGSSWGMSGSMGIAPMVSVSKTKPIYDEQKRVLANMLQTQQNRLILARQEALFQSHCFLLTPTPDVKLMGVGAAMTAFWGPATSGGDLPTRFHALSDLPQEEEAHLLDHVRTFSGCLVREPSTIGLERNAYSTVLTATELATLTHPPRIDLPGIQVSFEPIPPFRVPNDADSEIHLGHVINPEVNQVTRFRYGFDPQRMCHTLILGETRQGKSVSATQIFVNYVNRPPARVLVREGDGSAHEKLIPYGALVLDWKSEWRGILHHVPQERFRFVSLWNSKMGFKYNPLEVPEGIPAHMHLDTFSEALALSMNLGQRGRGLIRRTLNALYRQPRSLRYVDPDAPEGKVGTVYDDYRLSRFVGMADLEAGISAALKEAMTSKGGNSEREGLQVVQMRLQHFAAHEEMSKIYTRDVTEEELKHDPTIKERFNEGEFAADGCLRLADLIGPGEIVVMEGGPLENAVKKALVTTFATAIFTWARIHGSHAFNPEHMLVLEEAHEVLTGGDSSAAEIGGINETVWEQMWNEGGGLGLRLMAIAQMAERVPESVIGNSSSVVIHKLASEKSQQMAMIALAKDWKTDHRPLRRFIANIPQGWAVVRSVSSGKYEDADPVLVHPDYLRNEEPSDEQLRHYAVRRHQRH